MSTIFTNLTDFSPGDLAIPPKESISEDGYVAWVLRTGAKAEWVDGEVENISPANTEHTELRLWILTLLRMYCELTSAGRAMDDTLVRLSRRRRYRIPDIYFVSNERAQIIGQTMLREPPDLVIEIVSPDSSARDWREKYHEYEEFGIREYWVIDPAATSFEIYRLDDAGKYQHVDVVDGIFHSTVIAGLWLKAEWFAPTHRPTVREALRQLGAL